MSPGRRKHSYPNAPLESRWAGDSDPPSWVVSLVHAVSWTPDPEGSLSVSLCPRCTLGPRPGLGLRVVAVGKELLEFLRPDGSVSGRDGLEMDSHPWRVPGRG